MTDPCPSVGIVFNAYEPAAGRSDEQLSEESVAEVANEVREAVKKLGYPVTIIPLQRSFLNFLRRVKELEPRRPRQPLRGLLRPAAVGVERGRHASSCCT